MKKIIFLFLFTPVFSFANGMSCDVTKKYSHDLSKIWTESELHKWKFSVKVKNDAKPTIQRCSFAPSAGKVTCDSYEVDRVETDPFNGIKKFYYFRGQFDLQIFGDKTFLENNGRGGIAIGVCN